MAQKIEHNGVVVELNGNAEPQYGDWQVKVTRYHQSKIVVFNNVAEAESFIAGMELLIEAESWKPRFPR